MFDTPNTRQCLALVAICLNMVSLAIAQVPVIQGPSRGVAKNDVDERLKKLQRRIEELEETLQQARQSVRSSDASMKNASRQLQRARDGLVEKHASSAGQPEAKAKAEAARKAFSAASEPLLEAFRKTPEYVAAQAEAERAKLDLAALQKVDGLDDELKLRRSAELASKIAKVRELERDRLDRTPSLKPARDALAAAEQELSVARRELETRMDNDPEVRKLTAEFQNLKQEHDAAEEKAGSAAKQMTAARKEESELEFLQKGLSRRRSRK